MIIAEQKPIQEIKEMIADFQKVLVVGCGTCVTVCMAGGEKEVGILSVSLKMACQLDGKEIRFEEVTIERQCEKEFVEELKDRVDRNDVILSMGCGAGVQTIAERFIDKSVFPALNTKSIGVPEEQGVWVERCLACGDCGLSRFGGICPIARCSKSLLNGPCGGSREGKCEIDSAIDCAWQIIYDRLKSLGQLNKIEDIIPPKDWSSSCNGGPRKVIREDVRL